MQHEANDGDVQTQVLLDSTHQDQNSFAFTSFTDLIMVLLILLVLNFEELVSIFVFSLLTVHLPLQGRNEFSDPAVQDLFLDL
jgi:hypothetical protein